MALSDDQRNAIIFYLGWPAKTIIVGSTHYDQTIVTRMTLLDPPVEGRVVSILLQLDAVQVKFTASTTRMLVRKVGDIELNTGEHQALYKEYRRLLKDLSVLLDIPLQSKGGASIGVQL